MIRSFQEAGGSTCYAEMGISCGVVGYGGDDPFSWQYKLFLCFYPETLTDTSFQLNEKNIQKMVRFLESFDRVSSFNGRRFDDNLLMGCGFPANWKSHCDLCAIIQSEKRSLPKKDECGCSIRRSGSLDNVARHTLGLGKNGEGANVAEMIKRGLFEEVMAYCRNDVVLNVYVEFFARWFGFVFDTYGIVPVHIFGGAPAWKFPGDWDSSWGDPKQDATEKQLARIRRDAGPLWRKPTQINKAEASALISALEIWNKKKESSTNGGIRE